MWVWVWVWGRGGLLRRCTEQRLCAKGFLMSERLQLSVPSRVLCVDAATYIASERGLTDWREG